MTIVVDNRPHEVEEDQQLLEACLSLGRVWLGVHPSPWLDLIRDALGFSI